MLVNSYFKILVMVTFIAYGQGQRPNVVDVGPTSYHFSSASPYTPRLNWYLAYQYCRSLGMELLTLGDKNQTQQLTTFIEKQPRYSAESFWTSGNSLGSDQWLWMTTGQEYDPSVNLWRNGHPPLTKADTLCMTQKSSSWDAANCHEEKHFICQLTKCYLFNYNRVRSNDATNTKSQSTTTTSSNLGRQTTGRKEARRLISSKTPTKFKSPRRINKILHFPTETPITKTLNNEQKIIRQESSIRNTEVIKQLSNIQDSSIPSTEVIKQPSNIQDKIRNSTPDQNEIRGIHDTVVRVLHQQLLPPSVENFNVESRVESVGEIETTTKISTTTPKVEKSPSDFERKEEFSFALIQ